MIFIFKIFHLPGATTDPLPLVPICFPTDVLHTNCCISTWSFQQNNKQTNRIATGAIIAEWFLLHVESPIPTLVQPLYERPMGLE
jgi:hypothetical protein